MTDTSEPQWDGWMDNPLMTDQVEGFTWEEPALYTTQTKRPYGGWESFGTPRHDRDEVTVHQAYHINKTPDEPVRVLKRITIWTVDEVPGDGDGQTAAQEILARNEQITQRRLTKGTEHQPAE